jgi:hypothetical protein
MRVWWIVVAGLLPFAAGAGPVNLNQVFQLRVGAQTVRFNPIKDADLRLLESQVGAFLRKPEGESKHTRRGLEEIERLTEAALADPNASDRERVETDLVETVFAVNNNDRPTIPPHFDAIMTPLALFQLFRPVGIGNKPAANLQSGPSADLSRRDPLPSSFWSPPAEIAAENLYDGFGRPGLPRMDEQVCRYAAPKETTGMNPGYEVECAGERVKLKFGEVSSEPLVTRMFWALGFHADPTDYAAAAKVAYDRRIFTEFNSRQPVRITFTVLWFIPVYSMNLQPHKDPFDYIAAAVLRDGRRWSGPELKRHLMSGTNFQPAIEAQLDCIVTTPANVQVKDPEVKSIGPWDYGQLDHANRREVRGAGLLAAWLGFFDTRFDNTKLRRVGSRKHPRLAHYFSDLGGGLGKTQGLLAWHGEDVAAFPWSFTEPPQVNGKGRVTRSWRIVGYKPVVRTPAFAAMTFDDARWMARLIGQLRPAQITQALTASGYHDDAVHLYARKLISRRNKMMADLGLSAEFPPLTP